VATVVEQLNDIGVCCTGFITDNETKMISARNILSLNLKEPSILVTLHMPFN